jgi:uncharacterized membrane protein (UPF0182 family)
VALLTGGLVAANLLVVASTLSGIQIKRRFGNLEISEQLPRTYVRLGILSMAVLVALWFGAAVAPGAGLRALLLLHATDWGAGDPVLGKDLSFYVFVLPVLTVTVAYALVLIFVLFTISAAGYAATGSMRWAGNRLEVDPLANRHLIILIGSFLIVLAVRFWVARYLLLLDGSSEVQGIFGYTDAQARLPGFQALTGVAVISAGFVIWGGFRGRAVWAVAGIAGVAAASLGVGQVYPATVQRFRVEPNELERETPYIEYNLEFTRRGFGLQDLQRQRLSYTLPDSAVWAGSAGQFSGLPAWGEGALLTTYREIEARFPYYDFVDVAIDRYPSSRGIQPVAVAVREVDPGGIQDPNWQNLHIRERYLVGMGAVASAASGRTAQGRPLMHLSAIPPEFSSAPDAPADLELRRAQVFFGASPQPYAIVNPTGESFLAPDGSPGVPGVDFPEGIRLRSALRKLALAWRFRDPNLLFASEVSDQSRFVFRRQIRLRASQIAPFLRFPAAPYPVVHEGRIVWLLDGYTVTRHFPLSSPHELENRRPVSYLRNSVKVAVDGVSGVVSFHVVDEDDPVLATFGRAFPGLLHPLEDMPEELKRHLRYPRELLALQSRVLFQYHQETSPTFHGQQDVWSVAQELSQGTNPVPYRPEYGYYELPGETTPEFLVSTVFVPQGRQNLTALFVARCDPERYGELLLYEIPVESQVPGPRQVEALVEQDPVISQQFSLWRQGGSQVWTGHLHVVPAGRSVLYMEPIFLAAEEDAIPELRRFVVSDGREVSMMPTLEEAIAALAPGAQGAARPAADRVAEGASAEGWPVDALRLLDEAEQRLRAGDWAGFGTVLEELRRFLEAVPTGPSGTPGTGDGGSDPGG